jgi:hypothetical protein
VPIVAPLIALGTLAIVLWVIALAAAIAIILGYISGALSGLPFPINKLAGPVKSLAQGITNVCGKLEAGVDHLAGAAWHTFARYLDHLWQQLEQQSVVVWEIAHLMGLISGAIHRVEALVHSTARIGHGVTAAVKALTREYHGIEHRVKVLERDIAKGIGHDVLPRVKTLEREVGRIEHSTIPAIRAAEDQAEAAIGNLWEWVRQHTLVAGTSAFAGAVAIALTTLGLDWIKCNSAKSFFRRAGCGFWKLLEDGLAMLATLALSIYAVLHPEDLAKAAVAAVDEIEPILAAILKD